MRCQPPPNGHPTMFRGSAARLRLAGEVWRCVYCGVVSGVLSTLACRLAASTWTTLVLVERHSRRQMVAFCLLPRASSSCRACQLPERSARAGVTLLLHRLAWYPSHHQSQPPNAPNARGSRDRASFASTRERGAKSVMTWAGPPFSLVSRTSSAPPLGTGAYCVDAKGKRARRPQQR